MKNKNEKGVTGIDIILSVILITIFIGILTTLSFNIESKTKKMDKKAEAVYYAVNSIEIAKGLKFVDLPKVSTGINKLSMLPDGYIKDETGKETPYYRTTEVIDYVQLPGKSGQNLKPDLVKKISVKIEYKENEIKNEINLTVVKVNEQGG